jgi:hypothetical protein
MASASVHGRNLSPQAGSKGFDEQYLLNIQKGRNIS